MHGLIFHKLKTYSQKYGKDAWTNWVTQAGLDRWTMYLPGMAYPDEEIVMILQAASQANKIDLTELLEDFGLFIAPELLALFPGLIKKDWKTLDLIEHTEKIIHTVVRKEITGAEPPTLDAKRESPTRLILNYQSARRLCPLLKGIVKGLAKSYKEKITITEQSCMLKGDGLCTFIIESA